jgi:hypothetical protein
MDYQIQCHNVLSRFQERKKQKINPATTSLQLHYRPHPPKAHFASDNRFTPRILAPRPLEEPRWSYLVVRWRKKHWKNKIKSPHVSVKRCKTPPRLSCKNIHCNGHSRTLRFAAGRFSNALGLEMVVKNSEMRVKMAAVDMKKKLRIQQGRKSVVCACFNEAKITIWVQGEKKKWFTHRWKSH